MSLEKIFSTLSTYGSVKSELLASLWVLCLSLDIKVGHPQAWQKNAPNAQAVCPLSLPSTWKLCSPGPHFHLFPDSPVVELKASFTDEKALLLHCIHFFYLGHCWWMQGFPKVGTFLLGKRYYSELLWKDRVIHLQARTRLQCIFLPTHLP